MGKFHALLGVMLITVQVQAATLHTSQGSWTMQVSGPLETIDFNNATSTNTVQEYSTAAGLTIDHTNFNATSARDGYRLMIISPQLGGWYHRFTGSYVLQHADDGQLTIAFAEPVFAFSFVVGMASLDTPSDVLNIELPDGQTFSQNITGFNRFVSDAYQPDFIGIVSDTPMAWVKLSSQAATWPTIDDLQFTADSPAVPGPLSAIGILAMMGWIIRRRQTVLG